MTTPAADTPGKTPQRVHIIHGAQFDLICCQQHYAFGFPRQSLHIDIDRADLACGPLEPGDRISALINTRKSSAAFPSFRLPDDYSWCYIGKIRSAFPDAGLEEESTYICFDELHRGRRVNVQFSNYAHLYWGFLLHDDGTLQYTTPSISARIIEPDRIERTA